jgi:hypothetical protein
VVPPSKGSASASVILFSCHHPQRHRPQPLATNRAVEQADGNHYLQQTTFVLASNNHASPPTTATEKSQKTKETQQSNCSIEEEI